MDCINGIDDDGDGFTDRADDDCVVREGVSRRPRRLVDGLIRRQGAAPVPFRRGDADGDGRIELADGIAILQAVLAARGQPVACLDALDADDDGRAGIADALPPLRYLFQSGPEPAPPFATCGNDPTADTLSCVESNCPGP
jgi:hypothetical protein